MYNNKKSSNLKNAINLTGSNVVMLKEQIDSIKSEGRTKDWTNRRIGEEIFRTKKELKSLKTEMDLHLITDRAAAKEMVKPPASYEARTYHLQRAAALAQGQEPGQLAGIYEQIVQEPETYKYKNEYKSIFASRIPEEEKAAFESVVRKHQTPEETAQERELRALDAMEKHLNLVKGQVDIALDELEKNGTTGIDIQQTLEGILGNVEKQRFKDLAPEDKPQNQETMQQARE